MFIIFLRLCIKIIEYAVPANSNLRNKPCATHNPVSGGGDKG